MAVHWPLRARLQLAAISAVLLFGTLNVVLVGRLAYRALKHEQDQRLAFVARLLAQRAARLLLLDDRLALSQLLDESRRLDPDLAYIVALNARGEIVVQSATPSAAQALAELASAGGRRLADHAFREEVAPVLEGRLGEIRVGVTEHALRRALSRVIATIAAMVLVFLLAGMIVASLLARSVTEPVGRLVTFASSVRLEGELPPLAVSSGDEIEELAFRLREVALRLQELHAASRRQERELARVERLAALGTLAAGIAHEVNNPLAGIRTALERLLRDVPDAGKAERYGVVLREAVARIERAVQGTLSFARTAEVQLAPAKVAPVVERALELASPRLERSRVAVEQHLPAQLPLVTADAARLTEALLNLILNACDAMPHGGVLRIAAGEGAGRVSIEVQDSGAGIAEELRERIFQPFFTTKLPGAGTGLGLAVSRAAVREMGGELLLVDSGTHGSCFRIELAVAAKEMHGAHPSG